MIPGQERPFFVEILSANTAFPFNGEAGECPQAGISLESKMFSKCSCRGREQSLRV